jgi:sensor histidine kinase YesM
MLLSKKSIEQLLKNRLAQHILFWVCILFYFIIGYTRNGNYSLEIIRSLAFLPDHMFLVYSFLYFLIPRFLLTKRFVLFFVFGVAIYSISIKLSYVINFDLLGEKQTVWNLGAAILGQATVLGPAIAIKLLKQWYHQKDQLMQARTSQVLVELELLKSQVHPHFLFNTLNNLYAHTLKQSTDAPQIVLKLSNLLRFMIYESKSVLIPLKKEIFLLQQYIELEQLRYGSRLDISFSVRGDIENKEIAPLLLLPLVENAFKHGTSRQLEQCWISLDLEVKGDQLIFKLVNSKDRDDVPSSAPGGVGLQNVRKRLGYLYESRHTLEIADEAEVFIVNLQLQLAQGKVAVDVQHVNKKQIYVAEMPDSR